MNVLRAGTVNCPRHAIRFPTRLLWEVFAGMRLIRTVEGRERFRAKCPRCKREYLVNRPRKP